MSLLGISELYQRFNPIKPLELQVYDDRGEG